MIEDRLSIVGLSDDEVWRNGGRFNLITFRINVKYLRRNALAEVATNDRVRVPLPCRTCTFAADSLDPFAH